MLQLQIGFPAGRYFAASMADPRKPEWPPHPSRVYSALVAAAYAGGRKPTAAERNVLHKLESAEPPVLSCPEADVADAPDSYVPVNDSKSRLSIKHPQGVLLPNRQARQFPAAFMLDEPQVMVRWELQVSPDELQSLDDLAARVTHLGTSHSLVTAAFTTTEMSSKVTMAPVSGGDVFVRVPTSGRLDELDRIASMGHGTLRRPAPLCESLVSYALVETQGTAVIESAYDWITLKVTDASWGADTAHTFARAARKAVMSILGDEAPAAVHGHDDSTDHLAWLPLVDVGHEHANGKVRGLAVALPRSMSANDRGLALAGLARLERVVLPDGQVARVTASIDGPETPKVLRAWTWSRPTRYWSTVTPVILDRPPKRADAEKIAAALAESLVNAGFPAPTSIYASPTSDFDGAPSAFDVPTRLPRFHARIVFPEPIAGPVLAGRWKNFGIGLFRPTPMEDRP